MSTPFLSLEGVGHSLPDGRRLFAGLDFHLDHRHTGLVGANGVGKSLLAAIMAGRLQPGEGRRWSAARIAWLPQQVTPAVDTTVADLAGVAPQLAALARIEAGSVDPRDFERVGEHWGLRDRLRQALVDDGLGHLSPEYAAQRLSGGECTRIALIGVWLSEPDAVILDEPGNHLDRRQRSRLLDRLAAWRGGLLVVSHDRELLSRLHRIVELSPSRLSDHDGNYDAYIRQRRHEHDLAEQRLAQARSERRRVELELRRQCEEQAHRQAGQRRKARDSNQAKVLLGNLKQWSQVHAGRRQHRRDERAEHARQTERDAAAATEPMPVRLLSTPLPDAASQRRVIIAERLLLRHVISGGQPLDLIVTGGERIALTGDNGSGKSTLLRTLAGRLTALAGRCDVPVPMAYLDQRLATLDPQASPLGALLAAAPSLDPAEARTRLALLGLPAATALTATGRLSGGERLKTALACALAGERPAELLLLDEPTNHLDLPSLQALERMLDEYTGAILVASHDESFLACLRPERRLMISASGWRVEPW